MQPAEYPRGSTTEPERIPHERRENARCEVFRRWRGRSTPGRFRLVLTALFGADDRQTFGSDPGQNAPGGTNGLLIDTDPQGNCAKMLGVRPDYRLEHVIEGEDGEPYGLPGGLELLASSPRLATVAQAHLSRPYNPQLILSEKLERFTGRYDYAVLDTSPSYSALTVNVLFYAERVLVPINMETLAADGLKQLVAELREMQEAGAATLGWITPTMVDGRKGLSGDMVAALEATFGDVVTPYIRYAARFSELPEEGRLIYDADPRSRGAMDYAKLTGAVLRGA